jgi:hypothetical protein
MIREQNKWEEEAVPEESKGWVYYVKSCCGRGKRPLLEAGAIWLTNG